MFFYYLNPSETMTRYYASNAMTYCYSFGKDGTDIYIKGDENTASIKDTGTSAATAPLPLYDLQGRRVTSAPRPGIYIQEGRKRTMK